MVEGAASFLLSGIIQPPLFLICEVFFPIGITPFLEICIELLAVHFAVLASILQQLFPMLFSVSLLAK